MAWKTCSKSATNVFERENTFKYHTLKSTVKTHTERYEKRMAEVLLNGFAPKIRLGSSADMLKTYIKGDTKNVQ